MVDLCGLRVTGSDCSSAAQSFSQTFEHNRTEKLRCVCVCVSHVPQLCMQTEGGGGLLLSKECNHHVTGAVLLSELSVTAWFETM